MLGIGREITVFNKLFKKRLLYLSGQRNKEPKSRFHRNIIKVTISVVLGIVIF